MNELEGTLTARAKFVRPQDRRGEDWEFIRELDEKVETTVYCTLDHANGEHWSFTGPWAEARAKIHSHRRRSHYKRFK